MSDVLGRPVAYQQTSIEDFTAQMSEWGANDQTVREMTEMLVAQDEGLYEADWKAAIPTSTDFRTWCQQVLRPATNARGA